METGQQKEAMWKEEGADDSDTLLLTYHPLSSKRLSMAGWSSLQG